MSFSKKTKWVFFKKFTLITIIYWGFSLSIMAGLDHRPHPDAPKSQREFSRYLALTKGGDAQAQYVICIAYYDGRLIDRDFVAAAAWCRLAAEQGLAKAQYYMGYFYLQELGVERDNKKARYWLELAANQGQSNAQNQLGKIYENGIGVIRDHKKAMQWYQLAANQGNMLAASAMREISRRYWQFEEYLNLAKTGDSRAQFKVCFACVDGFINNEKSNHERVYGNLDKNLIKEHCTNPIAWGIAAANQGFGQSQYYLGQFYLHGHGVEKNIEQALYWFKLSAENETHGGTENYLGDAYKKGEGVEQNRDEAIYWYELAAKKGNSYARRELEAIRNEQ